jgi:hypothetical protein
MMYMPYVSTTHVVNREEGIARIFRLRGSIHNTLDQRIVCHQICNIIFHTIIIALSI